MTQFISVTSRSPAYSKVSVISDEINRPFWRLGKKYPNFPFGFLFCFDCVPQDTRQISDFKLDKKMPEYRNEMALIFTITIFEENIKKESNTNEIISVDHVRKSLGKEFFSCLQNALRKQLKKYPVVKELYFDFIDDVEKSLREISWIGEEHKKQKQKITSDRYYYDQDDSGLSRETSHPNFLAFFKEGFYFDPSEEESPFGNDVGFDTLRALEDYIKNNGIKHIEKFPNTLMDQWSIDYHPPEDTQIFCEYESKLRKLGLSEVSFIDKAIFAAALGQIKITGKINRHLKKLACLSFRRMLIVAAIQNINESELLRITYEDLELFNIYS